LHDFAVLLLTIAANIAKLPDLLASRLLKKSIYETFSL
jgi:hypothetical protein